MNRFGDKSVLRIRLYDRTKIDWKSIARHWAWVGVATGILLWIRFH